MRFLRRIALGLRDRIAELVPSRRERCGKSPVVGAGLMLVALVRELTGPRDAEVALEDGAAKAVVDLSTVHGRRIFAYGFCEPAAGAMRSLLRPGDVAIDAGANIGLFSLVAAVAVGPGGRVIACEPSPGTAAILRSNVERNRFDWTEVHQVAVADCAGVLPMHVFSAGSGFSSFAPADTGTSDLVDVPVTTLDELAGDLLERVRVVKIDVEGAETRALQGASALLERARPDFIIELEPDHLARQGSSVEDLRRIFEDVGYVGCSIEGARLEPLTGPWNRPAGDPNIVVRPRDRIAP
jgi:FkbM family methyltransferase